jgi:hypothetical protein
MKIGIIPCRADIDTDARWWEYSHTIKEERFFGYKVLHLTSTTAAGELIVPLTAASEM